MERWEKGTEVKKSGKIIHVEIPDYGRRRLLTYADSFRALAESMEGEFEVKGEDREELLAARKIWENRQVLKENINEMARVMAGVACEVFNGQALDEKKSKKIIKALEQEGLKIGSIFCRRETGGVPMVGMIACMEPGKGSRGFISAEYLADMLSVLFRQKLESSVVNPQRVGDKPQWFVFVKRKNYVALTGAARAIKEGEAKSGDNFSVIESEEGRLTVLLCDGMGSGEKACADSEAILDLLEKMIEAGFDLKTAISLAGSAFATKDQEQNMSTLDICELELYEGSCIFCKIGGAASFLKRGRNVEQISISHLPLGMFGMEEPERVKRELVEGDCIVMVTDGVTDALEALGYEDGLSSFLSALDDLDPQTCADRILQYVLHCSNGHIADDMSVIVLGIHRL